MTYVKDQFHSNIKENGLIVANYSRKILKI